MNSNENEIVQMIHSKTSSTDLSLHVINFLMVFVIQCVNSIDCFLHFINKIYFVHFLPLSITLSVTINDDHWFILCVFRKIYCFNSLTIQLPKQTNNVHSTSWKQTKYSVNNYKIIWFISFYELKINSETTTLSNKLVVSRWWLHR